jgi:signal transduction histidine kinase
MSRRVPIGAVNPGWPVLAAFLCACVLILAARPASSAPRDESKRVLILHSFGRDFRPWGRYARTIREELERQSPWQLNIEDHSLITIRSIGDDPEPAFVAYLNALNSKHSPDIVISIGAPAANFVQRNRARLFAATPMVMTAVEKRRIELSNLSDNDTVVAVAHDFTRSFKTILRVLPGTKQIVVINGASPNEKFWRDEMRKEAELLADKVQFIWYDDVSFLEILKKSAVLPPDTAIFWHLMNIDATGVAYEGDAALRRLYAVSNAPIFSYDDGFFGQEIVGGLMYSVLDVSRLTATVAVRILGGEKPGDIKPPTLGYAHPKFDWRQLQRWHVSEVNLPPGSEVLFREPGVWEKYRWQALLIAGVILIQGLLISGLLHERHRRRVAEVESRQRLAELVHLNRHAAFSELTTSIAHEINQPLGSILTNAETAELMLKSPSPNLDEVREILVDIRRDDQRASEVIRRLRSMLKKTPFEVRDIDLNGSIREVIRFVTALAHGRDIELKHAMTSADLRVKGDPVQLQQVILNLIINAMDAISDTQAKKREVSVLTNLSGAFAEIRVSDTGPGISADNLKNVFDPFFTTKPQGMGMGLAIVRTIVEAHHGQISAANHASGGALFTIRLPVARGRSTSA